MWVEFFILGGVWFWLLTVAFIIALIWEISGDRGVAALFTVGVYLGLIHLFGNATIFSALAANPAWLYIGIPVYFVVGALWSLGKWYLYVKRDMRENYKEQRMEWLHINGMENATLDTPIPEEWKVQWVKAKRKPHKILARRNKGRIMTWMTFWPFSALWAAIDEPWRYIYDALSELFQRISDHVYRHAGVEEDFDAPESAIKLEEEQLPGISSPPPPRRVGRSAK